MGHSGGVLPPITLLSVRIWARAPFAYALRRSLAGGNSFAEHVSTAQDAHSRLTCDQSRNGVVGRLASRHTRHTLARERGAPVGGAASASVYTCATLACRPRAPAGTRQENVDAVSVDVIRLWRSEDSTLSGETNAGSDPDCSWTTSSPRTHLDGATKTRQRDKRDALNTASILYCFQRDANE